MKPRRLCSILIITLLCLVIFTSVRAADMIEGRFLHHMDNTGTWNIDRASGDYITMGPSVRTEEYLTVDPDGDPFVLIQPSHNPTGLIGGGMDSSNSPYACLEFSVYGSDNASGDSVTFAGWFNASWIADSNDIDYKPMQLMKIQGSRTNEYIQVDYSVNHPGKFRFQVSDGEGNAWVGEDFYEGQGWVYLAVCFDRTGTDTFNFYIFDGTGTLQSTGSRTIIPPGGSLAQLNWAAIHIGSWDRRAYYPNHPAQPVDPPYSADIIDEVSVQGYLTQSQLQAQVDDMVLGNSLNFVIPAYTVPTCGSSITFLNHFEGTAPDAFDINTAMGDIAYGDGIANIYAGSPSIVAGYPFNGSSPTSGGVKFNTTADLILYPVEGNFDPTDGFTIGLWVKSDTAMTPDNLDDAFTFNPMSISGINASGLGNYSMGSREDAFGFEYGALHEAEPLARIMDRYTDTGGEFAQILVTDTSRYFFQADEWMYWIVSVKYGANLADRYAIFKMYNQYGVSIRKVEVAVPDMKAFWLDARRQYIMLNRPIGTALIPGNIVIDEVSIHNKAFTEEEMDSQAAYLADGNQLTAIPACECGDLGTEYKRSDFTSNCVVDYNDLGLLASKWQDCTVPGGAGCQQILSESIPSMTIPRGTAVVDGDLSEWGSQTEWYKMNPCSSADHWWGSPADVTEAKFAIRWNETTDKIYIAVVVEDTEHVFVNVDTEPYYYYPYKPSQSNRQDALAIFSQGDAAGGSYDNTNATAQYYRIGYDGLGGDWGYWGYKFAVQNPIPASANFEYKVRIDPADSNRIIYEVGLAQFDNYGGAGGSGGTVASSLQSGDTIKLDVIVESKTVSYGYGIMGVEVGTFAYNLPAPGQWIREYDASEFLDYTLNESYPSGLPCGNWGYLPYDLNKNCRVDLADFATLANEWLLDTNP